MINNFKFHPIEMGKVNVECSSALKPIALSNRLELAGFVDRAAIDPQPLKRNRWPMAFQPGALPAGRPLIDSTDDWTTASHPPPASLKQIAT